MPDCADEAREPVGRRGVTALVLAIIAPVVWWAALALLRPAVVGDELFHQNAVVGLTHGQWPAAGYLKMPPGFHAIAAVITLPWNGTLIAARAVVVLFALVTITAAWQVLRRDLTTAPATILTIALGPLFLPYAGLVYTDVPGLCGVTIVAWAVARQRWWIAAAAGFGAVLIRQTSLVWVGYYAIEGWRRRDEAPRGARLVPLTIALAAGALVLFLLRDQLFTSSESGRPRFNPAQFFLFAFCVAVLWAPLWIQELARMWKSRLAPMVMRGWGPAAVVAGAAVLCQLYRNPHPWNADPEFLRNRLLVAMDTSPLVCGLACAGIVAAAIALAHFFWRQSNAGELAWLWIMIAVYLGPHWLVDPRYYLVPFTLLHLTIRYSPVQARRLAVWNAAIGVGYCSYLASTQDAAVW